MSKRTLRILDGYSLEMLAVGIGELAESVTSGRAGDWEKNRLKVLRKEQERRTIHIKTSSENSTPNG